MNESAAVPGMRPQRTDVPQMTEKPPSTMPTRMAKRRKPINAQISFPGIDRWPRLALAGSRLMSKSAIETCVPHQPLRPTPRTGVRPRYNIQVSSWNARVPTVLHQSSLPA